jgi:tetratricopeptide (TPR) repeat protein
MKNILIILGLFFTFSLSAQNIKEIDNLIASERFDDATNALLALKNSSPTNPYVYFDLGEVTLKSYINDPYSDTRTNTIKKAKSYFSEGVKADSLNPLNYVGMGIIELYKNNDTIKADTYFSKANALIPQESFSLFSSWKNKITDLHLKTLVKLETSELYASSPRFNKSELYYKKILDIKPNLTEAYIAFGDVLLSQLKASEAILQYKKALNIENTALLNYMVAKIYYLARNTDEAKKYYESALKLDSLFAPAYKGLGEVYYKNKKNKLAKKNFGKFLQLTGNNIPAKINYVKALYKAKDFDGTISIAEDILRADSSKTYLYRLIAYSAADKQSPDMETALTYIQKFFAKTLTDELIIKDYTYYSKILLDLKPDSSGVRLGVEMLEKAYLSDTTDNDMLVDLIKTSYSNKVYDIEIKYLSQKINNGDDTPNNYMLLGRAYYYNKDFAKADSVYTIVTAVDSLNTEVWKWKAYSLIQQDPELKTGLAKPAFDKIIEITNNEESKYLKERYEAYSYLGSYYVFSSNSDINKAVNYLKKSIELDLKNKQWQLKSYNTLAYVYYKSKQWLNAKSSYETILKLNPDDKNAPIALRDINKFLAAK